MSYKNLLRITLLLLTSLSTYLTIRSISFLMLTFNTLWNETRWLAVIYIVAIIAVFSIPIGLLIHSLTKDRRQKKRQQVTIDRKIEQVEQQLQSLSESDAVAQDDRVQLAITGLRGCGKSALCKALLDRKAEIPATASGSNTLHLHLLESSPLGSNFPQNRDYIAQFKDAAIVIFMVTMDLTEHELHAINLVRESHGIVLIALNKIDTLSQHSKVETMDLLRERLGDHIKADDIVAISCDPMHRTRIKVDARGNEQAVDVPQDVDLDDLLARLDYYAERLGYRHLTTV